MTLYAVETGGNIEIKKEISQDEIDGVEEGITIVLRLNGCDSVDLMKERDNFEPMDIEEEEEKDMPLFDKIEDDEENEGMEDEND